MNLVEKTQFHKHISIPHTEDLWSLRFSKDPEQRFFKDALSQFKALHNHALTCSISYAWEPEGTDPRKKEAQNNWIDRLAFHLEAAGFRVTLDRWDNMNAGDVAAFVQTVASRDKVFLIGTPLLKLKADQSFRVIHQEVNAIAQRYEEDPHFLFLVVREGEHSLSIPDPFKGSASTDMRRDADYPEQLMEMIAKAVGIHRYHPKYSEFQKIKAQLVADIQSVRKDEELKRQRIEQLIQEGAGRMAEMEKKNSSDFRLPVKNPNFVGREEQLTQMHQKLSQSQTPTVIHATAGLGGIGKTQLATEYAYRYKNEYDHIIWINASTNFTLIDDMFDFANQAGISLNGLSDNKQIDRIKAWFQEHPKWLLIFDNAKEQTLIRRYLPNEGGHVLITSRLSDWEELTENIVELDVLDEKTACELLRKLTKITTDSEGIKELAKKLGYLPLALVMAGNYIRRTQRSIKDYVSVYDQKYREYLSSERYKPQEYPATVYTTWVVNMEKIEADNPEAKAALELSAFMAPDHIPDVILKTSLALRWIRAITEENSDSTASNSRSSNTPPVPDIAEMIRSLRDYSMIQYDREKEEYNMHRLVQTVVRDGLDEAQQKKRIDEGMQIIGLLWGENKIEQWPMRNRIADHGVAVAEYGIWMGYESKVATDLEINIADHQQRMGNYSLARGIYERGIERYQRIHGTSDHLDVAVVYNNLGNVAQLQGQYEEAKRYYLKAIEIYIAAYGTEQHVDVGISYFNLGLMLLKQDTPKEAKKYLEKTHTLFTQLLPPNHPYIQQSQRALLRCQQKMNTSESSTQPSP